MSSTQQQPVKGMGSSFFLTFLILFIMMFILGDPGIRNGIAIYANVLLAPLIGFGGRYPVLTIVLAGIITVTLSTFFTSLFMDWKQTVRAQEINKAFQKELSQARKENNTYKVKKLMGMQPKIMQMTMPSSSGMTKQMIFVMIFITPIFIWMLYYLPHASYLYFTTPWAQRVPLYERSPLFISNWFLLYLVLSLVFGQVIRQTFKAITISQWWQKLKANRKSTH